MRATFEAAAISELARRTLRSPEVTFEANKRFGPEIDVLSTTLSDASPALNIELHHIEVEMGAITINLANYHGGRIGGEVPDDKEIWIPGDISEIWNRYMKVMLDLAKAGYPGCVGCAGPAAEIPWDEEMSRRRLR